MTYVNDKLLDDVRRVGWHVLGIHEDATTPTVAHTVGLFKTFRHPEIVVVGLKSQVLMQIVGDLGNRVAAGARIGPSLELDDVVEGYTVRFAQVLSSAYGRFLPGAVEFYASEPFEAVQCLWPDKQGRFPTDLSFDGHCMTVQPPLSDPEWTPIYATWTFQDSYVLACYTTRFVLDGSKPIALVTHDEDGSWQFLCGTTNTVEDAKIIALQAAVKIDPSVAELADLPRGWEARRAAPGEAWVRAPSTDAGDA